MLKLRKVRKTGFYRNLFFRGFPYTFFARLLILYFKLFRKILHYVVIPLGFRKRVVIPSYKNVKDFDEALIYVYFGSMYESIKVNLPKGGICVDVGAHYGFWSLKMSSRCKLVIALEPVPGNFAVLYNSIMASNAKNTLPFMLAAGEAREMGTIVKPRGGTDEMYTMQGGLGDAQEKHMVRIIDLDTLLDKLSIQRISLVKVDVEGFEEQVLKGLMKRITRGFVDFIILEIHTPLLLHKCLKLLKGNYDLKVFKVSHGLYIVYAINKASFSHKNRIKWLRGIINAVICSKLIGVHRN
jgi:FkbM family methyltransferase